MDLSDYPRTESNFFQAEKKGWPTQPGTSYPKQVNGAHMWDAPGWTRYKNMSERNRKTASGQHEKRSWNRSTRRYETRWIFSWELARLWAERSNFRLFCRNREKTRMYTLKSKWEQLVKTKKEGWCIQAVKKYWKNVNTVYILKLKGNHPILQAFC